MTNVRSEASHVMAYPPPAIVYTGVGMSASAKLSVGRESWRLVVFSMPLTLARFSDVLTLTDT